MNRFLIQFKAVDGIEDWTTFAPRPRTRWGAVRMARRSMRISGVERVRVYRNREVHAYLVNI